MVQEIGPCFSGQQSCYGKHLKETAVCGELVRWCEREGAVRLLPTRFPTETKAKVVELYNHGLSIRALAKLQGVSRTSAFNWIKELAKKIYEKPALGSAILIELDEMWRYLGSKKNKLWIWKAYRHETGELTDWECGARAKDTFSKLMERLAKWDVELFRADHWGVYPEVIGENKLLQSKTQTFYLDQNNGGKGTGMRGLGENPLWSQKLLKW